VVARVRLERLWRHYDLWCLVILTDLGHRCGYVGVPPGHPANAQFYDDVPVDVHGGLTWAGPNAEFWNRALENSDGVPDLWYLGFDCGHAWDAPDLAAARDLMDPRYYALRSESPFTDLDRGGHVWTTEEVVAETQRLAEQLHVMALIAT
jgi:hypothetical protein